MINISMHEVPHVNRQLAEDFIADKTPLRTYAGFAEDSEYAGQARRTFSLMLSRDQMTAIYDQVETLYQRLIADCWPDGERLPFDYIRLDAYANDNLDLQILEINARNAGMHESTEWLDIQIGRHIGAEYDSSLNAHMVANQRVLHQHHGSGPLLYASRPFIPQWLYLDELRCQYGRVAVVTNPEDVQVAKNGIVHSGQTYTHITKKFAWPTPKWYELEAKGIIRIMQPSWMRKYGEKDYLQQLSLPIIPKTRKFSAKHVDEYEQQKDALVLKITDGGGARGVYIGADCTDAVWRRHLLKASAKPGHWVVQDYCNAWKTTVIGHGHGQVEMSLQLGIFVVPNRHDPRSFSIDIALKGYTGQSKHIIFDPAGYDYDIWFGTVICVS